MICCITFFRGILPRIDPNITSVVLFEKLPYALHVLCALFVSVGPQHHDAILQHRECFDGRRPPSARHGTDRRHAPIGQREGCLFTLDKNDRVFSLNRIYTLSAPQRQRVPFEPPEPGLAVRQAPRDLFLAVWFILAVVDGYDPASMVPDLVVALFIRPLYGLGEHIFPVEPDGIYDLTR
jgi:hypothetical protein